MRALVATGLGRLEALEVPDPAPPGRGQLLVRARVSAVSAGTEKRKLYSAELGPNDERPPWPVVGGFGYLAAGVVEAVGPDVEAVHLGDRVACTTRWGAHRELLDVAADAVVPLPQAVGFAEGAAAYWAVPPLLGIIAADPAPGEEVGVVGLGPLALLAVQLFRARGHPVVAFDPVPTRRARAERWGARVSDPEQTADAAPSAVLEVSGTQPGLELALRIVRPLGRIALVGSLPLLYGFDLFWPLQHSGASIVPLHRPATGSVQGDPAIFRTYLPPVLEQVARDELDVASLLTWVVPWDEGRRAMDLLRRRPDLGIGLAFAWSEDEVAGMDAYRASASAVFPARS